MSALLPADSSRMPLQGVKNALCRLLKGQAGPTSALRQPLSQACLRQALVLPQREPLQTGMAGGVRAGVTGKPQPVWVLQMEPALLPPGSGHNARRLQGCPAGTEWEQRGAMRRRSSALGTGLQGRAQRRQLQHRAGVLISRGQLLPLLPLLTPWPCSKA